jgi:FKBP-type peptidyl-prolyl cis-trans isomerase
MKKLFLLKHFGWVLSAIILFSCDSQEKFEQTVSGLEYKFYIKNDSARQVKLYDIVEVQMNYRTRDSVLFASGNSTLPFQIDPIYEGDLLEGIMLMHQGDSATFVINTEDFFIKMMQSPQIPDYANGEDKLYFDLKVVKITSETPDVKTRRLEATGRKSAEKQAIDDFVSRNNIEVAPTESGLYFIQVSEGSGPKVKDGDNVKVHYTGSLLDGTVYYSSYDRNLPLTFVAGSGEMLAGWEEAIVMMKQGGKARWIVPSSLAYGSYEREGVKPYSPLIFDVELIEIED